MDLIIFSGQSNMQGQSEMLTPYEASGCFEYKYLTDSLVPLKDPVGEFIRRDGSAGWAPDENIPLKDEISAWLYDHAAGGSVYGCSTLVPSFCDSYGKPCVAVHCAKGSTAICEWMPGTDSYNVLIKKSKAAIEKVCPEHIYFVWLQGESDACAKNSKDYYKQKITELKNALKAELGIEKFGVITVGRFTKTPYDDEIINAQREVCREDNDFLCLFDGLPQISLEKDNINPKVAGHYNARALRKIGKSAAFVLTNSL